MEQFIPQPNNLQLELGCTNLEFEQLRVTIEENLALMRQDSIAGMEYCKESMGAYGNYVEDDKKYPISGYNFRYDPKSGKISAFTTGALSSFDEYIGPNDKHGRFKVANKFNGSRNFIKKVIEAEFDIGSVRALQTSRLANACIEETVKKYNSENHW